MKTTIAAVALFALAASGAHAEVADRTETGFKVQNSIEINAPRATVASAYSALGEIGRWWDPAHTYSGKAGNLTLRLSPGACFCETLPGGGGVRHAEVVLAQPDSGTLRLEGALGPLQEMGAFGLLTFEVKAKGAGVEVVQTYLVRDLPPGAASGIAEPVDTVLRGQLSRFANYVKTGRPD